MAYGRESESEKIFTGKDLKNLRELIRQALEAPLKFNKEGDWIDKIDDRTKSDFNEYFGYYESMRIIYRAEALKIKELLEDNNLIRTDTQLTQCEFMTAGDCCCKILGIFGIDDLWKDFSLWCDYVFMKCVGGRVLTWRESSVPCCTYCSNTEEKPYWAQKITWVINYKDILDAIIKYGPEDFIYDIVYAFGNIGKRNYVNGFYSHVKNIEKKIIPNLRRDMFDQLRLGEGLDATLGPASYSVQGQGPGYVYKVLPLSKNLQQQTNPLDDTMYIYPGCRVTGVGYNDPSKKYTGLVSRIVKNSLGEVMFLYIKTEKTNRFVSVSPEGLELLIHKPYLDSKGGVKTFSPSDNMKLG